MYQLGSLFIFGQKLVSVYIRVALRMSFVCFQKYKWLLGIFFWPRKFVLQQDHIDFDIKGL